MNAPSGRDAAFLAEMGIGVLWQSRAHAAGGAGAEAAVAAPGSSAAPASPMPASPMPLTPAGAPGRAHAQAAALADAALLEPADAAPSEDALIARMDWDELAAAVAACNRCGQCAQARQPVFGGGARQARWFVSAGASSAADEAQGHSVAGEAGQLLHNMLAAAGMDRATNAYVSNLVKCRPQSASGADRAPTAAEVAACRPYLERELALCGADTVLTLGQIAANGLLGKPLQEPLAGSRGQVHRLGPLPLVATLHPGELLRRGTDKALAWTDLCLAMAAHEPPA
ncbi:MAG: uracil-DNA glycosylase [Pseudomonadota bacterium]